MQVESERGGILGVVIGPRGVKMQKEKVEGVLN